MIKTIEYTLKVDGRVKRNESVCSIAENVIFTLAGFDAPQMNFVSKSTNPIITYLTKTTQRAYTKHVGLRKQNHKCSVFFSNHDYYLL